MIDAETKSKALGRLRRIEGQVQGLQRMVEEEKPCIDVLLQLAAVQGAVNQVQKILLGRHLEACVSEAIRSGSGRDRQKKVGELLEAIYAIRRPMTPPNEEERHGEGSCLPYGCRPEDGRSAVELPRAR